MITGTRTAPLALPNADYLSSTIRWLAVTPAGTSATVEFSRDGGVTWLPCANDGPLPGLKAGEPLAALNAWLRQTLTTDDAAVTPTLSNLQAWINTPSPGPAPQFDESLAGFVGTVGDVQVAAGQVTLAVESPLAALKASIPRSAFLPSCANSLYDGICGLDPAAFSEDLAVAAAASPRSIPIASAKPAGYYDLGKVTFTSGANKGLTRTVKQWANGDLTLVYPLPAVPAVGDTLTVTAGCDKTRATCQARFSNLAHFRGFPFVPDPNTQYAGQGSSAPSINRGPGQGVAPRSSERAGLPNYKRRQLE